MQSNCTGWPACLPASAGACPNRPPGIILYTRARHADATNPTHDAHAAAVMPGGGGRVDASKPASKPGVCPPQARRSRSGRPPGHRCAVSYSERSRAEPRHAAAPRSCPASEGAGPSLRATLAFSTSMMADTCRTHSSSWPSELTTTAVVSGNEGGQGRQAEGVAEGVRGARGPRR